MPLLSPRRLVANKATAWPLRMLAPSDDDAFGGVELPLDLLAPVIARFDVLIPPDRQSVGFKGLKERFNALAVLRLVRQENVGCPKHEAKPPPLAGRVLRQEIAPTKRDGQSPSLRAHEWTRSRWTMPGIAPAKGPQRVELGIGHPPECRLSA